MAEKKDIAVIINSRSRRSRDFIADVEKKFAQHGLEDMRVYICKTNEEIHTACKKEQKLTPDILVAGGGDGTIQTALNTMNLEKTKLAVLPLGTTNNFARSLNLPMDVNKCIEIIAKNNSKTISLGEVDGHYFTNLSAIGVSVEVANNVSDRFKRVIGRFAYYAHGIFEILKHKAYWVEVKIDEEEPMQFYTHQLVIANGKYHGLIRLTPGAKIDYSHLTVVVFGRSKNKLIHIKNIMYFVFPEWVRAQPLAYNGEKISVKTDPVKSIEIDGEPVASTPQTFVIRKDIVSVIFNNQA